MKYKIGTCLLLFLLTTSGSKAQQQARVTGFFSDMHYVKEAGDLVGTEVWIVYAGGGHYYAAIQDAEGKPSVPVIAPVDVSGSRVKFTVTEQLVDQDGRRAPDLVIQYEGTVTRGGLNGTVNSQQLNLKRRQSYWQ